MMLYEWDKDKDLINRREHKMPLEAGIAVFDDLNALDLRHKRGLR
ncbi:MAG: BrnT family toxin [Gammaproteobacteria bacterium]|nr:BrnT family toxin [Gammaproteobacteria bacterium]